MKPKTILQTTTLSLLLAGGLFAQDPFAPEFPANDEINPDKGSANQPKVDPAAAPNNPFGDPADDLPEGLDVTDSLHLDLMSAAQIKEAGITIRTIDPPLFGMPEGPGVHWVEISLDCSKLEDDQPAMMNLSVGDGKKVMILHS